MIAVGTQVQPRPSRNKSLPIKDQDEHPTSPISPFPLPSASNDSCHRCIIDNLRGQSANEPEKHSPPARHGWTDGSNFIQRNYADSDLCWKNDRENHCHAPVQGIEEVLIQKRSQVDKSHVQKYKSVSVRVCVCMDNSYRYGHRLRPCNTAVP